MANVFLHYVFDLWIEWWRTCYAAGEVVVVRYADDFVLGFEHEHEVKACREALRDRFAKFGLKLHDEKTRLIEFGRYATYRRRQRGSGNPETFDFLGFTHDCGTNRLNGWFRVKRRSIRQRMRRPWNPSKSTCDVACIAPWEKRDAGSTGLSKAG